MGTIWLCQRTYSIVDVTLDYTLYIVICIYIVYIHRLPVFEIKVLFCAPAGCIAFKNHAPGGIIVSAFLYDHIGKLEKACTCRVHRS